MDQFSAWCQGNSALVMAILTAVYVITTIVMAALSFWGNVIARRNIATLTKLEKERSRPVVDAELYTDTPFVCLRVTNHGTTPAYGVRLATTPRLRLLLGGPGALPADRKEAEIGLVEHGVEFLAPGAKAEACVGTFAMVMEVYPDLLFDGAVCYKDADGFEYKTRVPMDLRHRINSLHVTHKTVHHIAEEIGKLNDHLRRIGADASPMHVVTRTAREYDAEKRDETRSVDRLMKKLDGAS